MSLIPLAMIDIELEAGLPWGAIAHRCYQSFYSALEGAGEANEYATWDELSVGEKLAFEVALRELEECICDRKQELNRWNNFVQRRLKKEL
jgi:hypothetical protein